MHKLLNNKIILIAISIIGLFFWYSKPPQGLTNQGWHLLIIFNITIITIILKPLPMGSITLTCITILSLTNTISINVCLSNYSKPIVWMVVFAFFIAKGFNVTKLGNKLAYFFINIFSKNILGLAYGLAISDLLLAPAVPSNTARGAGIIFPIIKALTEKLPYKNKKENKIISAFLIKIAFHSNLISSTMFITAIASNPLIITFASNMNIKISWLQWMLANLIPGLIAMLLMPIIIYYISPIHIKNISNIPTITKNNIQNMKTINLQQLIMLFTFILVLLLWMFGNILGISPTLSALTGIVILLITKVLKWNDLIEEKTAWNTLIWFSILLMLADQMQEHNIINWLGNIITYYLQFNNKILLYITITIIYFYIHYFFASATAMVSSIYPMFLILLINADINHFSAIMSLAAFNSLSACLTHYGTGTAPVYFGSNYITMKEWWLTGIILSIFYITIWLSIGNYWWFILGYLEKF